MNYPIWRNTTFYFDNLAEKYDVLGIFPIKTKYEMAVILNKDTHTVNICVSDGWLTQWAKITMRNSIEWEDFCSLPKYVQNAVNNTKKLFLKWK